MTGPKLNSQYLQSIHQPAHIDHLIKSCMLQEITYDTETTDLDKKYTALTQFAAAATDVSGRIISSTNILFRVPDYIVMAPQAALVTQSFPHEIHYGIDRDPPHIAAGKVAYFFKNIYQNLWDDLEHTEMTVEIRAKNNPIRATQVDGNYETRFEDVRIYEVIDKEGVIHTFRLHNNGKSLAYQIIDDTTPDTTRIYRDIDGTRWKKVFPRSLTNGFNNMRADDSWIMMTAFMSGMADIIIPYLKENQLFRVDTRTLAKAAAVLNVNGENGFQPGHAISVRTGQAYTSFGLSALMRSNTHLESSARGLRKGVQMPDGSLYDERLGHQSALYDVLATLALKAYIRQCDAEIVRQIELNSDLERLKNYLMGIEGFALRPLRTFLRDAYPGMSRVHVGICIDINENLAERPQAVLIRTDTDALLSDITHKGKHLVDMDVDELALVLTEQKGTADAIFEILDLRKAPTVFDGQLAFERGFAHHPERHEANRIFIQSNGGLIERIIEAHTGSITSFPDVDDVANPRAEEEVFTNFRELKQLEIETPNGKKVLLSDDVHAHAVAQLERGRNIDYVLRKLLEPDAIEWAKDLPQHWRRKALKDFCKKIDKAQEDLRKYHSDIRLPDPDDHYKRPKNMNKDLKIERDITDRAHDDEEGRIDPDPKNKDESDFQDHGDEDNWGKEFMSEHIFEKYAANAVDYIWKLRATLRHAFYDYSLSYRVHDIFDQEIDFNELLLMPDHIRSNCLAAGNYTIKFEQLNYSSEKVMRLFTTVPGRMDWLKSKLQAIGANDELIEIREWEEYFNVVAAVHAHGPPHVDVDDHLWMSANKGLKEIERIRRNFQSSTDVRPDEDMPGLWDLFVSDRAKAEAILDESEKHYKAVLKKYPFTSERQQAMGYDPKGWPIESMKYPIAANSPVLMVDTPEQLLSKPLHHLDVGSYLLPIIIPHGIDLVGEFIQGDLTLLLRGNESGRVCLAANVKIMHQIKFEPYFGELYAQARNRYADSNVEFPKNADDIVWLKLERIPEKVPVALRPVDATKQIIRMPCLEYFEATVSPALGMRQEYVTGFVIKDEGATPVLGKARIMGPANDNREVDGWERETTIHTVRSLTLQEFRDAVSAGVKRAKTNVVVPEDRSLNTLSHAFAIRCGYDNLEDMKSKITHLFTDRDRAIDGSDSRLHIGIFAKVRKETTTYFDPTQKTNAGFVRPLSRHSRELLWNNPGKKLKL